MREATHLISLFLRNSGHRNVSKTPVHSSFLFVRFVRHPRRVIPRTFHYTIYILRRTAQGYGPSLFVVVVVQSCDLPSSKDT